MKNIASICKPMVLFIMMARLSAVPITTHSEISESMKMTENSIPDATTVTTEVTFTWTDDDNNNSSTTLIQRDFSDSPETDIISNCTETNSFHSNNNNNTISSEEFETRLLSERIIDFRNAMNTSSEAVTTRYFSSEEINESRLLHTKFNLTTIEPRFSNENESFIENKNNSKVEDSSEAILTVFINSAEKSDELVTTVYRSMESSLSKDYEDSLNETFLNINYQFNLTTLDPFSSESAEYVAKILKHKENEQRKIILVVNDSEEITSDTPSVNDDKLYILRAKPEEIIPLYKMNDENTTSLNTTEIDEPELTNEFQTTLGPQFELIESDYEVSLYNNSVETNYDYYDNESNTTNAHAMNEPSLDGQVLGLIRRFAYHFR